MMKWSASDTKSGMLNRRVYFYSKEILSDFQERVRAAEKEKGNLPDGGFDHVGMETINPSTNSGRYFVEFASSATIHGLNHLVAPHRHPIEKFLATLFIAGALLCLIFLSLYFWDRYQNEASVIVLDNDRDNFRIRKPSYIVRPRDNFRAGNVSSIFQTHGVEYTRETEDFFRFLSGATYETMSETPSFDRVPPNKWLGLLYDLRQGLPNHILKVKENYIDGEPIITERGISLAFRSNVRIYASFEYWTENNFTVIPFPKEIPYYDYDSSMTETETITVNQPIFVSPILPNVSLYDPNDMIEYQEREISIGNLVMHLEALRFSELVAPKDVHELSVRQRRCKVPLDGGLATWPIYTPGMCTIECRMDTIQQKCGCRPHFARPINGVPICNAQQLRCIADIKDLLFLHSYVPSRCGCLPKCDDVFYQSVQAFISELKDNAPTNLSTLRTAVEFPTVIYRRAVLFGFNAFLTSVGGAAGLFLGASVLSFVEIFYYVTLRMLVYVITLRQRFKVKRMNERKIHQFK